MMKFLPRNSQCPYCHTVYRYGDLKRVQFKKNTVCYHCHKELTVSRKGWLILLLEMMVIYAVINILAIGLLKNLSFGLLFLINLIPTAAAVLLLPLYAALAKKKNTNE